MTCLRCKSLAMGKTSPEALALANGQPGVFAQQHQLHFGQLLLAVALHQALVGFLLRFGGLD